MSVRHARAHLAGQREEEAEPGGKKERYVDGATTSSRDANRVGRST